MSQKLENLLNLALETPENIREKTDMLNVGFQTGDQTWEVIVKYHGSLGSLSGYGILIEYLIAGYAILTVPQTLISLLSTTPEIEYVEMPKRFYYQSPDLVDLSVNISTESCLFALRQRPPFLTGNGILIAVLDSGIDYSRSDFRDSDGSSRILFLWDQTLSSKNSGTAHPPAGFLTGAEFTKEQIDTALQASSRTEMLSLVPSIDANGHGTAVAGIAAGNAETFSGSYQGAAPDASLLIVKLGLPEEAGFPRTTQIMRGVTYALQKAQLLSMPLVINLSFGNSYGAHSGSSLLERFLDNAAEIGRTVICVGSGNEGNSAGHTYGNITDRQVIEWTVASYERNLSLQLWKNYSDTYRLTLKSPSGAKLLLPDTKTPEKFTFVLEQTEILIYFGEPTPYSSDQEIYFEFLPSSPNPYITDGIWQLLLSPVKIVTGQYYCYLPASGARNVGTGFSFPVPDLTLTIPSTASKVITVGAYNSFYDSYADFSGRGLTDAGRTIGVVSAGLTKPDLVAPGYRVPAPDLYGGYQAVTGTSFAAPIVSGSAALCMEWGILQGFDPYLYGEKVKAYLRGGARALRGETVYPNSRTGFGALCLASSLPVPRS